MIMHTLMNVALSASLFPTKFPLPQFLSLPIRLFTFVNLSDNDARYTQIIAKERVETFAKWVEDTQRTTSIPKLFVTTSHF